MMQFKGSFTGAAEPIAFSFGQQFILNMVGPVVTVAVGGILASLLFQSLQQRRERREILETLTIEMFQVAYAFYITVDEAHRKSRYGESLHLLQEFDARFEKFQSDGRVIEARLRLMLQMNETRWIWHCLLDLLTIHYFTIRHTDDRIKDLIAGQAQEHTITEGKETIPKHILETYLESVEVHEDGDVKTRIAAALDELIRSRRQL